MRMFMIHVRAPTRASKRIGNEQRHRHDKKHLKTRRKY